MKKLMISFAVGSVLAISACANSDVYSGDVYLGSQAKEVRSIAYGTIVSMRPVKIQAHSSGMIGSVGGGVVGGIAGGSVGGGRGRDLMGAVGSVVGAILGSKLEEKANQVDSLEMVIRKDNGMEVVVVQKQSAGLQVGRRVRLVGTDKDVNVSPL